MATTALSASAAPAALAPVVDAFPRGGAYARAWRSWRFR
jgi:hypothetical protein